MIFVYKYCCDCISYAVYKRTAPICGARLVPTFLLMFNCNKCLNRWACFMFTYSREKLKKQCIWDFYKSHLLLNTKSTWQLRALTQLPSELTPKNNIQRLFCPSEMTFWVLFSDLHGRNEIMWPNPILFTQYCHWSCFFLLCTWHLLHIFPSKIGDLASVIPPDIYSAFISPIKGKGSFPSSEGVLKGGFSVLYRFWSS